MVFDLDVSAFGPFLRIALLALVVQTEMFLCLKAYIGNQLCLHGQ